MVDIKKAATEGLIGRAVGEIARSLAAVVPAALAAAGGICVAALAFLRDEFAAPLSEHWRLFLICAAAFFFLGLAAGAKIRDEQRKKVAARASGSHDGDKSDDLAEAREAFMQAPVWIKAMIKASLDKGEIYCKTNEWNGPFHHQDFIRSAFRPETLPGDRSKLAIRDKYICHMSQMGDLLECVTDEEMRRYRVVDETKRRARDTGKYNELTWWYADDYTDVEKAEERRAYEEMKIRHEMGEGMRLNVFEDGPW